MPLKGLSKNPLRILFSNAKAIERMIREEGVDLVHARSRAPAWSAYIAARRAGVPFVTTYHGAYSQKGRLKAFYNSVMAKGDIVIANSHYTARLVIGRNPDAENRTMTIHRGVDMDLFDPQKISDERIQALRSKWELDARPVMILPSRLTRWKGQSFIIPVMGALKKAIGPTFQLLLIGDEQGRESYVAELDRLIAEHDVADCVSRVGHCKDMPAALCAGHYGDCAQSGCGDLRTLGSRRTGHGQADPCWRSGRPARGRGSAHGCDAGTMDRQRHRS